MAFLLRPARHQISELVNRFWGSIRSIPALLAGLLCVLQISLPWTTHTLVTEDGPSHLYTSVVARNLAGNMLLGRNSHYGELYRFNPHIVPNWGSTLVLSSFATVVGVSRAEQVLMTFCLMVGFFSISYAIRSFSPTLPSWMPVINVLIQVWFLWLGFYNFYLGMVLAPFVIGYLVRNLSRLTILRAGVVGAGMCVLFLTHLIAAALAGIVIVCVAVWVYWIVPAAQAARTSKGLAGYFPDSLSRLALLFLLMLPTLGLLGLFVTSSAEPVTWHLDIARAFADFPMHVFVTASGRVGGQFFIWPVVLFLIALSFAFMRSTEWLSRKRRAGVCSGPDFCSLPGHSRPRFGRK